MLQLISDDLKSLETTNQVIVFSDKTTNLYKMDKDNYNKLLKERHLLMPPKSVAAQLHVADPMDVIARKNAFITGTLKDHKDNFTSNPNCRSINTAKTKIGIISKKYLENINKEVAESTILNQRQNTNADSYLFCTITHDYT